MEKEKAKSDEEISLIRNAVPLSKLLHNISNEEASIYKNINEESIQNMNVDFTQSFILFSKSQVYKTYSIVGLMKNYDRNTKYTVLDLGMFLDIWYNTNTIMNKPDILNPEILIIHGSAIENSATNRAACLIEMLSIRKTMNKTTWFYVEGANKTKFDNAGYGDVISMFLKVYNIKD